MPWTIAHFPELEHLAPAQRAALLASIPRWTYAVIITRALALGAMPALLLIGLEPFGLNRHAATLLGIAITAIAATACYYTQLSDLRTVMRKELATAFASQRPPFCFNCGYDLRATTEPRCPECGADASAPPTARS